MAEHANNRLLQRASNAANYLQSSQANQDFGRSAYDMQQLADHSPNNLRAWWNSNPSFQSALSASNISTANLNLNDKNTVRSFTTNIFQRVSSQATEMDHYTSQAHSLISQADSARSSMAQANTHTVSQSESSSISASVSSASTSTSQQQASYSTAPLNIDKNANGLFWKQVHSARAENNYMQRASNRYSNRYSRRRNSRYNHPSYSLYSTHQTRRHGSRNPYGFNILDYCDYKGIQYKHTSGNTYKIVGNGNGHGDFSSLDITQFPNQKRIPLGGGHYKYVNAHDGKTYSQINRFSTKLRGLKGLDSLTQFIMNYEGWDRTVNPQTIKKAKAERDHFFKAYAAQGHTKTGHSANGAVHVNHNITRSQQAKQENQLNPSTAYKIAHMTPDQKKQYLKNRQIKYNKNIQFRDNPMKAAMSMYGSSRTANRLTNRYSKLTHQKRSDALTDLQAYAQIRRETLKNPNISFKKRALSYGVYGRLKKHLPQLRQVNQEALNDINNFVNKNIIDNSIVSNYVHNHRAIDSNLVNYFTRRGLIRGLKADKYPMTVTDPKTGKKTKKIVHVDPRIEFIHRIPNDPKVAHSLGHPNYKKAQQVTDDVGLSKGPQEEKPAGADYIYLKLYHKKDPKTGKTIAYYDKDHQAYGNSKKVDKGSTKNYAWNFRIGNGKDKLFINEAPLDSMSMVNLFMETGDHEALHNATFLALGGADSKNKTIQNFINAQFPKKGQYGHIILAPDNDWAGYNLVQDVASEFGDRAKYVHNRSPKKKLITVMVPISDDGSVDRKYAYQKKHGIKVNGKVSPFNKDWNEMQQKYGFMNIKFYTPGKSMNLDQYGQHTVNQLMLGLNRSDQQKFDVIANLAGRVQQNDRNSSELIDRNNPRIQLMSKAYNSMTSRVSTLAHATHIQPNQAHAEIHLFDQMSDRNHQQRVKLFKKSPYNIRKHFLANYKQIQKISNSKYGQEKLNRFMTVSGNFLPAVDISRYAKHAYIGRYHHPNKMLNNSIVQKELQKPYPKPKAQVEVNKTMKSMSSDRARKLFATTVRSCHNIDERRRYMDAHRNLFPNRKNIYNAQIGVDKVIMNQSYTDLSKKYPKDAQKSQNLMQKLHNTTSDEYSTSDKYVKQYMQKNSEFPYRPNEIVANKQQQAQINNYRQQIDYNRKQSWEKARQYDIKHYHKDPAKKYKKHYHHNRNNYRTSNRQKAVSRGYVSHGVSNVYKQATKTYHYILMDTKTGIPALKALHKKGISDATINKKMIGFAPKTQAGVDILKTTLKGQPGISQKDIQDSHLFDRNGKNHFENQVVYPDAKTVDDHGVMNVVSVKQMLGRNNKGAYLAKPDTLKTSMPRTHAQSHPVQHQPSAQHRQRPIQRQQPTQQQPNRTRHYSNLNQHPTQATQKDPLRIDSQHFVSSLSQKSKMPGIKLIRSQIDAKITNDPKKKSQLKTQSISYYKDLSKRDQKRFSQMKISNKSPQELGKLIDFDVNKYEQKMSQQQPKQHQSQPANDPSRPSNNSKQRLSHMMGNLDNINSAVDSGNANFGHNPNNDKSFNQGHAKGINKGFTMHNHLTKKQKLAVIRNRSGIKKS